MARIDCPYAWDTLYLAVGDRYGPCCRLLFDGPFPESREAAEALYNSPSMRQVRRRLVTGEVAGTPCAECSLRRFQGYPDELLGMAENIPLLSGRREVSEPSYRVLNQAYQAGAAELPVPPLRLALLLGERCNLRCRYCAQQHDAEAAIAPLAVVRLVEAIGWSNLDTLILSGGEPFYGNRGRELAERLAGMDTRGGTVRITTNGTLLPKRLEQLERIERLHVIVSVDGYGESYEQVRVNGRWELLEATLRRLSAVARRHPLWRIAINSLATRSSYPDMPRLYRLARELGFTIRFYPVAGNLGGENPFLHPEAVDLRRWQRVVEELFCEAKAAGDRHAYDSLLVLGATMREALERRLALQQACRRLVESCGGRPVVAYGVSDLFRSALDQGWLQGLRIAALSDSDPTRWGQRYRQWSIVPPAQLSAHAGRTAIFAVGAAASIRAGLGAAQVSVAVDDFLSGVGQ